jgi:peptidoglycan/LPS O-acetylase OafA/YrhL
VQHFVAGTAWTGLNCVYYVLFTAGMAAAWLVCRAEAWPSRAVRTLPWLVAALAAGFCVVMHHIGSAWVPRHEPEFELLTGLVAFPAVLASVTVPAVRRTLSQPRLVRLGEFSYSLYLIHMPLLQLLIFDLAKPVFLIWGGLAGFAMTLVLIVPTILWLAERFASVYERPFTQLRSRLAPARRQAASHSSYPGPP